jgi:hypothetical protein
MKFLGKHGYLRHDLPWTLYGSFKLGLSSQDWISSKTHILQRPSFHFLAFDSSIFARFEQEGVEVVVVGNLSETSSLPIPEISLRVFLQTLIRNLHFSLVGSC